MRTLDRVIARREDCLVWCAIGDAYGKAHEFADGVPNDLSYHPHPKYEGRAEYTDDTQQSLALVEHMNAGAKWSRVSIADRLVSAYKRDRRGGYSSRMEGFLKSSKTGKALIDKIKPIRASSGAVMRAWPAGAFGKLSDVQEASRIQALSTHPETTVAAAMSVASCFHYFLHLGGRRGKARQFNSSMYGIGFAPGKRAENEADSIAGWYFYLLDEGPSDAAELLRAAVAVGGDVDTLASLLMVTCCVCQDEHSLPSNLFDELENGPYGRDYLAGVGTAFIAGL